MSNGGTGNGSKPFKLDANDLATAGKGLLFALIIAAMQWLQDWSSETDFGIWGPIVTSAIAGVVLFGRQWVKDNSKALIFAFALLVPTVATAQSDLIGGPRTHSLFGSATGGATGETHSSWKPASKPQIVIFTASWCSLCEQFKRRQQPRMERSGWRFGNEDSLTAHVRYVDTDKRPDLGDEFDVVGLPLFVIMDGTEELNRRSGYMTAEELNSFRAASIKKASAPPPSGKAVVKSEPKKEVKKTALCQCQGYKHSVCMCLAEMRAGIRPLSKPCGCSRSKASEHYIDDQGKPAGGTGRYIRTSSKTTVKPATRRVTRSPAMRTRPVVIC